MRRKKRVLVTAFGATVALTLQTPVSAFIVKARKAAVAPAVTHHNPPSYLADAFSDAGRRVLQADRWNGWRAGVVDSALADDLDAAPALHQARVDSTLGGLELGYLGADTAAQGRNSSLDPASGDSATANTSFTGGSGAGGGGGAAGMGGVGGGGGGGAGGVGAGDEASGSRVAASAVGNASSDGSFAAGEFGALPGVSAGRNTSFTAVPVVLVIADPNSGTPGDSTPPLSVESPEPTTLVFLGAGLAGLAARRLRRSRSGRGQPAIR
jgi:PEP-CTERM motif-containing protein